ncbi:MAG: hypothetical protein QM820_58305 [Minicystis sp.]
MSRVRSLPACCTTCGMPVQDAAMWALIAYGSKYAEKTISASMRRISSVASAASLVENGFAYGMYQPLCLKWPVVTTRTEPPLSNSASRRAMSSGEVQIR